MFFVRSLLGEPFLVVGSLPSLNDYVAHHIVSNIVNSQNTLLTQLVSVGSRAVALSKALAAHPTATANGRLSVFAVVTENGPVEDRALLRLLNMRWVTTPAFAHPTSPEAPHNVAARMGAPPSAIFVDGSEWADAAYADFALRLAEASAGQTPSVIVVPLEDDAVGPHFVLGVKLKEKFAGVKIVGALIAPRVLASALVPPGFDNVVVVEQTDAASAAVSLISKSGLIAGLRTGAAAHFARIEASKLATPTPIWVIVGDSALSHPSTLLNSEWLFENNVLDPTLERIGLEDKYRGASVEDLQLPEAVSVQIDDPVADAINLMVSRDFSQVPVLNTSRKLVGWLSLGNCQSHIRDGTLNLSSTDTVEKWMYSFTRQKRGKYVIVTPATPLQELEPLFETSYAYFVTDSSGKFTLAIVTKADLLRFLAKRGAV
ncbi:hypothetical protein BJ742DRAFT_530109 [Cladochytrium replicatum]|nr:hypothetical protein BJ742DRAFT_530109 [Cladochytrium replicatum]